MKKFFVIYSLKQRLTPTMYKTKVTVTKHVNTNKSLKFQQFDTEDQAKTFIDKFTLQVNTKKSPFLSQSQINDILRTIVKQRPKVEVRGISKMKEKIIGNTVINENRKPKQKQDTSQWTIMPNGRAVRQQKNEQKYDNTCLQSPQSQKQQEQQLSAQQLKQQDKYKVSREQSAQGQHQEVNKQQQQQQQQQAGLASRKTAQDNLRINHFEESAQHQQPKLTTIQPPSSTFTAKPSRQIEQQLDQEDNFTSPLFPLKQVQKKRQQPPLIVLNYEDIRSLEISSMKEQTKHKDEITDKETIKQRVEEDAMFQKIHWSKDLITQATEMAEVTSKTTDKNEIVKQKLLDIEVEISDMKDQSIMASKQQKDEQPILDGTQQQPALQQQCVKVSEIPIKIETKPVVERQQQLQAEIVPSEQTIILSPLTNQPEQQPEMKVEPKIETTTTVQQTIVRIEQPLVTSPQTANMQIQSQHHAEIILPGLESKNIPKNKPVQTQEKSHAQTQQQTDKDKAKHMESEQFISQQPKRTPIITSKHHPHYIHPFNKHHIRQLISSHLDQSPSVPFEQIEHQTQYTIHPSLTISQSPGLSIGSYQIRTSTTNKVIKRQSLTLGQTKKQEANLLAIAFSLSASAHFLKNKKIVVHLNQDMNHIRQYDYRLDKTLVDTKIFMEKIENKLQGRLKYVV